MFSPSIQAAYRKANAEIRIGLSIGAKVAKTVETLSQHLGKRFDFGLKNGKTFRLQVEEAARTSTP